MNCRLPLRLGLHPDNAFYALHEGISKLIITTGKKRYNKGSLRTFRQLDVTSKESCSEGLSTVCIMTCHYRKHSIDLLNLNNIDITYKANISTVDGTLWLYVIKLPYMLIHNRSYYYGKFKGNFHRSFKVEKKEYKYNIFGLLNR